MSIQLVIKLSEVKLLQALADLRLSASGWQALHFHLSELQEEYKSEYQIKIAINLINDLLKNYEGGMYAPEGAIFVMLDNSIVVLCSQLDKNTVNKLIFQLRYLYMDDPLAYTEAGLENPAFCSVYNLKSQWEEFHEICSRHMALFTRNQPLAHQPVPERDSVSEKTEPRMPVIEKVDKNTGWPEAPEVNQPLGNQDLSASKLATIERDLRNINLQQVIRRQPVCAILADMNVRRVFDEIYIHIAHLKQIMKSEVDFLSNRWLFKYLTHVLDEKMIELIRSTPMSYLNNPISLNLNVETLLSSRFAEFDKIVKPESKVAIVIEVPVVDVFADMAAYQLARQEVQKLGYRVCLDGLTMDSFVSLSRETLGLDLMKVQWNADVQNDLKLEDRKTVIDAVKKTGSNRVILCRCDNRSAIEYGHALGISLFQGRYIDNLLNPTAKVEN